MPPIFLHNTLGNKKEEFIPIKQGEVSMYNCGPTVYDFAHIGNFRTFILSDILRRVFEYNGYKVDGVMNITDVDDKTIKRSVVEGISLKSLTHKYEELFFSDLEALNIIKPQKTPKATESIADMISLIEKMLENGTAYKSSDGVYFDIAKSPGYGTLAHLNLENSTKERVANDEYDKTNPRDFSLWKFYTKDDENVCYEAPFGKGRPGWHIECSAMSMKNLAETIDIHTGGIDLIFPHHTNEIAQSEAVTGKTFVHYWIHGGFITIDGKKMSKSLGNIFTLQTLKGKKIDPIAYRYFVLGTHYRSMLNFTWEAVGGAQVAWKKIKSFVSKTYDQQESRLVSKSIIYKLSEYKEKFSKHINNDLDTSQSLAVVFEILKDSKLPDHYKQELILDFDKVLGLKLDEKEEEKIIPENIKILIKERDTARNGKNFAKSDEIRKEIELQGFEVKDGPEGTVITPR
ncbi:MAG: cysteine--tRNA ligase [Candidatus Zambryskibacteria bacterium]|nr:cysteine--tRNA ligase [Candidatus Zambryskibacteria bacterium]